MFCLYARNSENLLEAYFIKEFETKESAFDFTYKCKSSFEQKGNWLLEVGCALTGKLVKDDRLLA